MVLTHVYDRLNDSRAQNIAWLLESLRLPYQIKAFKRMPSGLAPPEMKNTHPLGKSPVVSIEWPGSGKPLVLAESGNIFEYLIDHFGGVEKGLVPQRYARDENGQDTETESWLRYRFFMHYSEGSFMPNLVLQLILDRRCFCFLLIIFADTERLYTCTMHMGFSLFLSFSKTAIINHINHS